MVSYWSLSDSKSPQVSRTLLSIMVDLNIAVVSMVSTRPLISKSSSPCTNPLGTVRRPPNTTGVTFMFHNLFNSLARSRCLAFFPLSFDFTLWSAGTAKFTIQQVLQLSFFFFLLIITKSSRLAAIRWSVSPGQILFCVYTIYLYGEISVSRTIPSGSTCLPSRV